MEHKLHKEAGILECYAYSVKNSDIEEKIKNKEKYGIDDNDKVYGQPIQMVLNIEKLGDVSFFTPNKVELYEEGNFEDGTHIEFSEEVDMVLLISFDEFKKLYFDYKGITNGN